MCVSVYAALLQRVRSRDNWSFSTRQFQHTFDSAGLSFSLSVNSCQRLSECHRERGTSPALPSNNCLFLFFLETTFLHSSSHGNSRVGRPPFNRAPIAMTTTLPTRNCHGKSNELSHDRTLLHLMEVTECEMICCFK